MPYNLFDKINNVTNAPGFEKSLPPIPKDVVTFLGKLSLLEGVPMHYLVPDKRYLPVKVIDVNPDETKGETEIQKVEQGSLKFFWVDPEWIQALLNGALSIADDGDSAMLKKAMEGKYTAQYFYNEAIDKIGKQLFGLYDPVKYKSELINRLKQKNFVYGDPSPSVDQTNWCYTGFFIRSSIIASWVGVQVVAYDKQGADKQGLKVIKLGRIAADTIYCICEGIVGFVEIVQPTETIHFDTKMVTNLPMRSTNNGVLDVKAFKAQVSNSAGLAMALLSQLVKTELTIKRTK